MELFNIPVTQIRPSNTHIREMALWSNWVDVRVKTRNLLPVLTGRKLELAKEILRTEYSNNPGIRRKFYTATIIKYNELRKLFD